MRITRVHWMWMIGCLLSIPAGVVADPNALGVLVSPRVVIADLQTFWAGVKLNEGCPLRSTIDLANPPLNYCDVIWDKIPDGALISNGNQVIGADSLKEGSHVVSGVIHSFSGSDPTRPLASTPFRESIEARRLDVSIKLEGLPLDNFGDNRVYLSSAMDRNFSCIFYGGPKVETKISKIEDGKLWCHIEWLNIPSGFSATRPSSPAILEGRLANPLSEDVRDHSFSFRVKASIPYNVDIPIVESTVNASREALNKPSVTVHGDSKNDDDFFLLTSLPPTNLFPVSVNSDNEYPLALKVRLDLQGNKYTLLDSVVKKGAIVDTLFLSKDFDINFSDLLSVMVEGGYKDVPVETSVVNKNVVLPASRFFAVSNLKPSVVDGVMRLTGTIDEIAEGLGSRERIFRVYLANEDTLGSLERGVIPVDFHTIDKAVSLNAELVSKQFSLDVHTDVLAPGRYMVVVEQLASRKDDSALYVVDRILSEPISVHWVDGDDHSFDEPVNAATGPGGAMALLFVMGMDDACQWNHVGSEDALTIQSGMDRTSGLNYALVNAKQSVDALICTAKNGDLSVDLKTASLHVYKAPRVSITSVDEVESGVPFFAEVMIDDVVGDLDEYGIEWIVNDSYYGEAGMLSLDSLDEGDVTIEARIRKRDNIDVSELSVFTAKKVIHVKAPEEKDSY